MSKRQAAKSAKEQEARFGKSFTNIDEYPNHLDFRCMENFDDNAFAHLMKGIKGVNMLDVNETDIGNHSITLLTSLEYVNELRAKECINLTDDCTDALNKIESLAFLHLKSTAITIDGLLKLKDLSNLKTLMFSADDVVAIKDKLVQLKLLLPGCELVINSKPYYTNAVDIFLAAIKDGPFKTRLKIKTELLDTTWDDSLVRSETGRITAGTGTTYSIDDIEWVEIKGTTDIEFENETELNEPYNPQELMTLLENLEFPFMITDGILSVYLLDKEI